MWRRRRAGRRKQDFSVDLAARTTPPDRHLRALPFAPQTLSADYRHGAPLMDTHLPTLLSERLYHADGQIQDDLRIRFVPAKPDACKRHALQRLPRAAFDQAPCRRQCVMQHCHNATSPAAGAHIDTSGLQRRTTIRPRPFSQARPARAQCVDCHAPLRTYNVVDPRRDHSFRIRARICRWPSAHPTRAMSVTASSRPNGRRSRWRWPGVRSRSPAGTALCQALDAGRTGKPGAVPGLIALADDQNPASHCARRRRSMC